MLMKNNQTDLFGINSLNESLSQTDDEALRE